MAEQLFQIGVKAIIRDDNGQVLLQAFRRKDGTIDMWDLPGGRIDEGEGFKQALQRELKEEIDVDYDDEPQHVLTMLSNVTIPVGDTRVPLVLIAYEIVLPAGVAPRAAEEGSIIEWASPTEAASRLATKFSSEFCSYIARVQAEIS